MYFSSIDEIRRAIGSHVMDSRVENGISQYVTHAERESAWECLDFLLTHEVSKVSSMGLRVFRRAVRDRVLMQRALQLSFQVTRLSELRYWYRHMLPRFPWAALERDLWGEVYRREGDIDFSIHLADCLRLLPNNNRDKKREIINRFVRHVLECVDKTPVDSPYRSMPIIGLMRGSAKAVSLEVRQ
ncbi:hypothetical protein [Acidovorax sp. A1169]|uniref:hypothetical protein n=1 Tax=Acidovorax sp. A1169 TaxID=3059524 RepID=UPI002737A122|nr:hypothetical protein [Acidovorax sp. A1169]